MEVEADLFIVFQGFNPQVTGCMSIPELMRWHKIAIARNEAGQTAANAGA